MSRPRLPSTRTWWELPLRVPAVLEEPVVAALWDAGCLGVETRGLARPGEAGAPPARPSRRKRVLLAAFFPGTLLAPDLSRRVARALVAAGVTVAVRGRPRRISDRHWVEEWQKTLRPMPIGRRLLALPEGCAPPVPGRRIVLRIPFGQAFGTGEHASTRLSLALLESALRRGDRVIDLGTGTGILALAALRLGAGKTLAVDSDPVAVAVARRTCRMNGVRTGLTLRRDDARDALAAGRFDLALVNIGARVIRDLLPALARAAAPHARVVLAGILIEDEPDLLRRAGTEGLRLKARRRSRPWSALLLSAPARRAARR